MCQVRRGWEINPAVDWGVACGGAFVERPGAGATQIRHGPVDRSGFAIGASRARNPAARRTGVWSEKVEGHHTANPMRAVFAKAPQVPVVKENGRRGTGRGKEQKKKKEKKRGGRG